MKVTVRGALVPLRNQRGISLIMVLVAVVIIGIMLSVAGQTWTTVMQQAREEELLFRGDQYRRAIASYYNAKHGGKGTYPASIEVLLKDPRTPNPQRHLRQPYKDPFTGEDFDLISAGGQVSGSIGAAQPVSGFRGVKSRSPLKPFKQDGFPPEYEKFAGAASYSFWEFVYEPPQVAAPTPPPAQP
ncbi:MAG: hypothetical protein A2091_03175 [Desulfuromonadales bacterium GWD2_61_12]|nr:MAG: hypothetical protein A2005_10720 [Desulfuromonadales bacterium GWC2_61_20]OGR34427.1 MAG: hypothetical protein A2091_03175 [Desulfuromonadales bacterium GWD2_61_12]HAD05469.1 hypothetical protein [Desulfuromonas sp.]HBT84059.1 hypothetical protein [Desulfuromonas sp.]